ncbi:MAG: GFA family protein [Pseudomonadota bacterium]
MTQTGQCLCGNISYEFDGEPAMAGVCHCRNCQRQAGSAFSTLAGIPEPAFRMAGEPKLYRDSDTDSGNTVERYFCGDCGSPIYSAIPTAPGMIFLKTGTLDDTDSFVPQMHFWCSTKQNWLQLEGSVPQLAKTP